MNRVSSHPILDPFEDRKELSFRFDGSEMVGYEGEMLSSALFANGVTRFSIHQKGSAPQGIFCANGQCSQCTVIVDGRALKSCATPLAEGMDVRTLEGLPELPVFPNPRSVPGSAGGSVHGPDSSPRRISTDVLVVGGGPSGLGAAKELAALGLSVLIADDKERLGGKLLLQTHKFFGSEKDCYAGSAASR